MPHASKLQAVEEPVKDKPRGGALTRKDRALATRRRMTEAAYREFSRRGYARTTVDAVAALAGVAVQTVYFTFHTKAELLQAAYEHAVMGPEPVPPHLSRWWRAAESAPDVSTALGYLVAGNIEVFERAAPLVWAVHGDEDARPTYEFNEGLRRDGTEAMLSILAAKHDLRPGLTDRQGRDIMLTILGPLTYAMLTQELGWTSADYGSWARQALGREIFGVAEETPSASAP